MRPSCSEPVKALRPRAVAGGLLCCVAALLVACASKLDYEKTGELRPLEVPPDLNKLSGAYYSIPAPEPAATAKDSAQRATWLSGKEQDEVVKLSIAAPLEEAWLMVGVALERAGFTVTDRDRTRWLITLRYAVQPEDTRGFWARLFTSAPKPVPTEISLRLSAGDAALQTKDTQPGAPPVVKPAASADAAPSSAPASTLTFFSFSGEIAPASIARPIALRLIEQIR